MCTFCENSCWRSGGEQDCELTDSEFEEAMDSLDGGHSRKLRNQQLRNAAKTVHKWQHDEDAQDFYFCPECTSGRNDAAQCGVCRDGTRNVFVRANATLAEIEEAFGVIPSGGR